jgi:hypothetical protein
MDLFIFSTAEFDCFAGLLRCDLVECSVLRPGDGACVS